MNRIQTVDEYIASGQKVPDKATFTSLDTATLQDCVAMQMHGGMHDGGIADLLLTLLEAQKGDPGVFPVDRFTHGLQTASLAWLDGERDEETLAVALLHDVCDGCASNHAEVAAAYMKPFVRPDTYWLVKHHEIFQSHYFVHHFGGDPDLREKYRGHPHFEKTAYFCEKWDNPAFNEAFQCVPLEHFVPIVNRVFSRVKRDVWQCVDDD